MRLQYRLSNGAWDDCGPRTDEFLALCERFGGLDSRASVIAALEAGNMVRNDPSDWHSKCRCGDVAAARRAARHAVPVTPPLRCKCCGQTGRAGAYPFSTLPGSGRCDDCC